MPVPQPPIQPEHQSWLQWLWTLLGLPILLPKVREFIIERMLKKRSLSIEKFEEFVKRNDEQHTEVKEDIKELKHITNEAVQEFGETRRDVARVEGKIDVLLELTPRKQ